MLSVARFFAEQGLTVADIKDAAFYAANWVYSYAPSNSDVIFAANVLRASFTSNVRLPLGLFKQHRGSRSPTTSATTTSFAHNATPVVANNSASIASSAAVPATSTAPSTEAAPMSAEAVQQMDEISSPRFCEACLVGEGVTAMPLLVLRRCVAI
ncbi:hypothetical protein BDP27DRAFT_1361244 [Rhodocollybia butyracea]|uniref:Uncharacterized protein n=1 Tax=Rhodocollybia butyracea TaxID=206335 RepID=A0A9P5UAL9_9AGAR|nr:hypothetical protein BDP27DRAFT_1361244 [Rhodocollybia butyracea]